METRIYVVRHSLGESEVKKLVRAGTPAQAIRHAVKASVEARVAEQDDIVALVSAGAKVEEATGGD